MLRFALCSLAALLAVTGCGDDRDPDPRVATEQVPDSLRRGGTAVIGAYTDLQTMNTLATADYNSAQIQRELLFMPLIRYNDRLEPVPWLAERWDTVRVAPDSLQLTFHLRRDVNWHDGEPTTAEDVRFTFDRAVDPKTAFPNASAFQFYSTRAELVDPYTIRFRLKPHAEFLDIWNMLPVLPEHILGNVPPEQLAEHPFGSTRPVGNGPFRFVRHTPGQEWVFEANPRFPAALGGRPYLDRVVYRYIPEQTTLLTELLAGDVDMYVGANPNQAEQIRAAPGTELVVAPFPQWNAIAWNTRLPMFDTPEERRALSMAIDRRGVVDAIVQGYGEVGRSTVTPVHWSYDAGDPQTLLPYDTAQARRLLARAGWADRDGDGILEDAAGREFRFTLKTNQGNQQRKDIAEMIQAQLRPLGIVVEPQLVEWTTFIDQLQGSVGRGGTRNREFEAAIWGWVDTFRKDDKDILHSSRIDEPYQFVGYANPRVDQMLDSLNLITDRGAARELWKQYQRLMVQESPYTLLYYPEHLVGLRERLHGVEIDARGDFNTVAEWWIAPQQRRRGAVAPATPGAGN